jgi:hypothetical protein
VNDALKFSPDHETAVSAYEDTTYYRNEHGFHCFAPPRIKCPKCGCELPENGDIVNSRVRKFSALVCERCLSIPEWWRTLVERLRREENTKTVDVEALDAETGFLIETARPGNEVPEVPRLAAGVNHDQ